MPKHPKIIPITAHKLKPQDSPKNGTLPERNGSFVQISFSELLTRYFQQQQAPVTVQPETRRPKQGRKIIYLPKRSSDDSCSA